MNAQAFSSEEGKHFIKHIKHEDSGSKLGAFSSLDSSGIIFDSSTYMP